MDDLISVMLAASNVAASLMLAAGFDYHLPLFSSLQCCRSIDTVVYLHTEPCDALML